MLSYRSEYKENEELSVKFYNGLSNVMKDSAAKPDETLSEQERELLNDFKYMKQSTRY